jgi:hypothetical protein
MGSVACRRDALEVETGDDSERGDVEDTMARLRI